MTASWQLPDVGDRDLRVISLYLDGTSCCLKDDGIVGCVDIHVAGGPVGRYRAMARTHGQVATDL